MEGWNENEVCVREREVNGRERERGSVCHVLLGAVEVDTRIRLSCLVFIH